MINVDALHSIDYTVWGNTIIIARETKWNFSRDNEVNNEKFPRALQAKVNPGWFLPLPGCTSHPLYPAAVEWIFKTRCQCVMTQTTLPASILLYIFFSFLLFSKVIFVCFGLLTSFKSVLKVSLVFCYNIISLYFFFNFGFICS